MNERLMMQLDPRTPAQVREHYEIEVELAHKLKTAPREDRRHLYSSLYNELFQRVPHHPQLTRKASPQSSAQSIKAQMQFLQPFLKKDATFLEVGPGDCSLSIEVAKIVRQAYAVDVSDEITKDLAAPKNFQLIISDGCSIPVADSSVDVVYSNQLMEHLHPDDAHEQLKNIHKALAPGGIYICITPNSLTGPHDISRYFDHTSQGFHLKEYTIAELGTLFRMAGFRKAQTYVGLKGRHASIPFHLLTVYEKSLATLPNGFRNQVKYSLPFRIFRTVKLVASK